MRIRCKDVPGGVLAVGEIDGIRVGAFVPIAPEVGRFGSRLRRFGRRIARSKVLKGVARIAMTAADAYTGGQASRALGVARNALRGARRETAAAVREAGSEAPALVAAFGLGSRAARAIRPTAPAPARAAAAAARRVVLDAHPRQMREAASLVRMLPPAQRNAAINALLGVRR